MTIDQLVDMAERIHNTEHVNLGTSSTRDQRNAFWARVIGCAYWGHPVYNATPDRQWHLKRASSDRPQTDDVATSLPTRNHWDCIPGAGADGYSFNASFHGALPNDQIVYAPPKPDDSGVEPEPEPEPALVRRYPDENTYWQAFQQRMRAAYNSVNRLFPDPNDSDAFRRFSRCGFDINWTINPATGKPLTADEAADKHISELRRELGAPPE